ncbi:hypothetical protein IMZ68_05280 [Candidatus Bathyarchaeota archaeon]|nr:hypothetical protein [Candidatus Bathyarchaeota archaeon]
MYGVEVDIWADTGQIRLVQGAYSAELPSTDNSIDSPKEQALMASAIASNLPMIVGLSMISLAIMVTTAGLIAYKKGSFTQSLFRPIMFRKAIGILLCLLISSTILLTYVGSVSATTRGAAVWGSESKWAGDYIPPPGTWINTRKSYLEVTYQRDTADYIASYFASGAIAVIMA